MEFSKENSVERVSFTGGLIGLFAGSHKGRLEKAILAKNQKGWNLAEVIPDNPNLLIWIMRFVFLIVTLGLWTISNGYILVFERPTSTNYSPESKGIPDSKGRFEPKLTSKESLE